MSFDSCSRRNFLLSTGAVSLAGLAPSVLAQGSVGRFSPGVDYRVLATPIPQPQASLPEVIEFFWLACGHCKNLEPSFVQWKKAQTGKARVRRVHVAFRDNIQQRFFLTLEALGQAERLVMPAFVELHDRRRPLYTPDECRAWALAQGISAADYDKAYNSQGVAQNMKVSSLLTQAYGIDSVPQIAVGGRFVTSPAMTGDYQKLYQVLDSLIALSKTA